MSGVLQILLIYAFVFIVIPLGLAIIAGIVGALCVIFNLIGNGILYLLGVRY
jgi:nicotinamide riboside transporter PnuC